MWLLIDSAKTSDRVDITANTAEAGVFLLEKLQGCLIGLVIGTLKSGSTMTMFDVLMYTLTNDLLPQTVQIVISDKKWAGRIANILTKEAKYIKKGVNYVDPKGQL